MKSRFKVVCMIIEDNSAIEYQIQFSTCTTAECALPTVVYPWGSFITNALDILRQSCNGIPLEGSKVGLIEYMLLPGIWCAW